MIPEDRVDLTTAADICVTQYEGHLAPAKESHLSVLYQKMELTYDEGSISIKRVHIGHQAT